MGCCGHDYGEILSKYIIISFLINSYYSGFCIWHGFHKKRNIAARFNSFKSNRMYRIHRIKPGRVEISCPSWISLLKNISWTYSTALTRKEKSLRAAVFGRHGSLSRLSRDCFARKKRSLATTCHILSHLSSYLVKALLHLAHERDPVGGAKSHAAFWMSNS